jgi:hypothetical protein
VAAVENYYKRFRDPSGEFDSPEKKVGVEKALKLC